MQFPNDPKTCPNFRRPNRNRVKTTVYFGPDDRDRIEQIRKKRACTTADAIRFALTAATAPPVEPPDTTQIGYEILQWAENLTFLVESERRALREFSKRLYELKARKS